MIEVRMDGNWFLWPLYKYQVILSLFIITGKDPQLYEIYHARPINEEVDDIGHYKGQGVLYKR